MKGPWCSFDFDLISMKMTLNALRTRFQFATTNESGDKMNLVSFFFTFSEYENKIKSAWNPFSWLC